FSGVVYRFKDEASLKRGQALLAKNKDISNEEFVKEMNTEATPDAVTMQKGRYEFSKFTDVPKAQLVQGSVSQAVNNTDGSYTVVKTNEVFNTPSPKSLDDARGYVVAEYQDYLEKEWDADLRNKYPVKLDDKVFKSMVK